MRAVVVFIIVAWLSLSAREGFAARPRMFELVGDPFSTSTQLDYSFLAEPVNQLAQNRLSLSQTLSRDEERVCKATGRFGHLSATGTPYPGSLWDLEAGGAFTRKTDPTHSWGIKGSIGSASDQPFFGIHETVLQLTAHDRIPSGERNAWLFSLSYSNNRPFANNVPIPGVAYVVRTPNERFLGIFGLPFAALNYKATEELTLRFSYVFPEDLSLEMELRVLGPLRVFASLDWHQESWLPVDRPDTSQRLYFDSKAATGGLRAPLGKAVLLDLSGGYAFARRFFVAPSILQSKSSDLDLQPSPIAELHLVARI